MSQGQNDVLRRDLLAAIEDHAAHLAGGRDEIVDAALEADLPAERLDFRAQALDHADQAKRADVGPGDVENLLGRASLDEFGEHLAPEVARVADLAVELAVREGARAAFAELDVRFRVEPPFAPERPGITRAFAHGLAAL